MQRSQGMYFTIWTPYKSTPESTQPYRVEKLNAALRFLRIPGASNSPINCGVGPEPRLDKG